MADAERPEREPTGKIDQTATEELSGIIESTLSREEAPSAERMARYFAQEGDPDRASGFLQRAELEPQAKNEILAQAYDVLAEKRTSFSKECAQSNPAASYYYLQEADHWRNKARILRGEENK